jgi:hypothetical protein
MGQSYHWPNQSLIPFRFFLQRGRTPESIASFLHQQGFSAVICDDFEPDGSILPLKLTAVRAGVGWQGKNTLLISPDYGSFLALGGIITDAPLEADEGMEKDRCGKSGLSRECSMPLMALPLNHERCSISLEEFYLRSLSVY